MLGSTDIVAFVSITDPDRARAFYEGVLGLRFVKDDLRGQIKAALGGVRGARGRRRS